MMSENEVNARDFKMSRVEETDFADMLFFFREYFVILVIATFIGIAAAVAVYNYLPSKWQADITLEVGKVFIVDRFDYIDAPAKVVEKIKSPLFLAKIISKIYGNKLPVNSPSAQLFYKDLKVSVDSTSNLITMHVFGWSAEKANESAEILANSIVAEHREMAAPYLHVIEKRLTEVSTDLEQNRAALTKLTILEQNSPPKNETNALLKLALIDTRVSQIQKLREERAKLDELVSVARLQATRVVGKSLPPQKPTSPKLGLLVAGGALLGLLCGICFSLASLVRRRRLHVREGI